MHLLLLYNAIRHNPRIGYDGRDHVAYIRTLADGHLPTPTDTGEFFSPPLPYLFPAALLSLGVSELTALKAAQILQVLVSLALVEMLLKICELIWPGREKMKLATVALLAMLPVYYKTFAMIRGEPWVACFAIMTAYYVLQLARSGRPAGPPVRSALSAGFAAGMLLLSRQWGALVLIGAAPTLLLHLIRTKQNRIQLLQQITIATVTAAILAAWFYIHLHQTHGTFTPFNRPTATTQSHPPQHLDFTGLFTDPIKNSFPGQAAPILYSEIWGDYWCFFLIWGRDPNSTEYVRSPQLIKKLNTPGFQTNRQTIASYLGRVNLFGLLPTAILLAGFVYGLCQSATWLMKNSPAPPALFTSIILASVLGYLWFVHISPSQNFDTIKASYLLHIFPFLALLAAPAIEKISSRSKFTGIALWIMLALIAIHNIPACMTRYTLNY